MRASTQFLTILVALFALSACVVASKGVQITEASLAQIKENETTKAEVIELLGQPLTTSRSSDGKTIASWAYVKYGFGVSETQSLTVYFTPEGVVESYLVSESNPGAL